MATVAADSPGQSGATGTGTLTGVCGARQKVISRRAVQEQVQPLSPIPSMNPFAPLDAGDAGQDDMDQGPLLDSIVPDELGGYNDMAMASAVLDRANKHSPKRWAKSTLRNKPKHEKSEKAKAPPLLVAKTKAVAKQVANKTKQDSMLFR